MRALCVVLIVAGCNVVRASELDGVWVFQKETNARLDGTLVVIPGPAYQGLLIYTADGHVSANLMPKERAWRTDTATIDQLRATIGEGSSTGYAGRYEVDSRNRTVTHAVMVSVDPADTGRRLTRSYAISGDTLQLSGRWTYQGMPLIFTVYWVRARPGVAK